MKFLLQINRKEKSECKVLKNFNLSSNNIKVNYFFDERKPTDSFLLSNERYIILIIGVFFEENEITDRNDFYFKKIINLYQKHDAEFPKFLRGCFSGFIYDKEKKITIVFTDHTSCRRVFYYESENHIIFSSDMKMLSMHIKENLLPIEIDIEGCKMLLQNGYMINNSTLIKNIKKILPGMSVKYGNNILSFHTYFDINKITKIDIDYNKAIDEMERLFTIAIRREFNRDLLDKKNHLITLSGGLDSRAVRIVAKDLGYNNVTNITMSQSKYLDYSIALDISKNMNDNQIFFSLDNGKYLYKNVLQSCINNGGTALYNGNAHLDLMIDNINTEKFGILHTGMIGDAIAGGSFINNDNIDFYKALYSSIKKIQPYKVNLELLTYKDQEMNLLYNRGINGAFNGIYSTQRKMEAYSPFIDPDFISFMYSLPRKYLEKSKIYIDWMKKYHKSMLKYKWEKTNLKPSSNSIFVFIMKLYKALFRRIFKNNKKSMNPYDYWYSNNVQFRKEIQSMTSESLNILKNINGIEESLIELQRYNKVINNLLIISLANSLLMLGLVNDNGENLERK